MASWPKRTVDLARPLIVLAIFISGCAQQPVPREPQAQIDGGWEAYRLGDYAHAAQLFEAAEKSAGETHLQALYGLGSVWNLRRPGEDPAKAAEIYRKLIGEAPKHDLAAWSLLAIARMKHLVPVGEEPDLDAVRKAYQECIERFPIISPAKKLLFIRSRRTSQNLLSMTRRNPLRRSESSSPRTAGLHLSVRRGGWRQKRTGF